MKIVLEEDIQTYGDTHTYLYNSTGWQDQLTAYNNQIFSYDEIGNPVIYKGNNLKSNHGNRLVEYNEVKFSYNANGIRTSKANNGLTTRFYIENNKIYKQEGPSGDIWFLYGVDGVLGFRYRSYYYDVETNLYYLNSRYYDPETGRFINVDDLSYLDPESINGLNLYVYYGNNPIMRVDHLGTNWFNGIGNWFVNAGKSIVTFFENDWSIILGTGLVIGSIVISVVTFGAGTVVAGIVAGTTFGGAFGALGAAGMSLMNNRINGKKSGWDSLLRAGVYGLTAGVFAGGSNSFAGFMINGSK